jgi:hypothetical protein
MSADVGGFCSWTFILAIAVSVVSAVFFVVSIDAADKGLAWASLALFVASTLLVAGCSWRLWDG